MMNANRIVEEYACVGCMLTCKRSNYLLRPSLREDNMLVLNLGSLLEAESGGSTWRNAVEVGGMAALSTLRSLGSIITDL